MSFSTEQDQLVNLDTHEKTLLLELLEKYRHMPLTLTVAVYMAGKTAGRDEGLEQAANEARRGDNGHD